ncbi:MAG TPA: thiamine pyrophosphate-dependent enzyme, partial [Algoriphagus sp.]|nr:thiamine pyrophosphate-dependent enzyme [Algoriphagus sp.]
RDLVYFGVSGDGDSASIGMGQFVHVIRRNLNMVYVVMNNGCYGLTKGQDSATADEGSKSKSGSVNPFQAIDLASMAIELGASFVAQSFSGDKQQLIPLLKAAIKHPGFAFLNVISPCVTFNNNPGSTKSYDYVREHIEATSAWDFVPVKDEIKVSYEPGKTAQVEMHDGSEVQLNKLGMNWDPEDRISVVNALQKARVKEEILTGLLYVNSEWKDLHKTLDTVRAPLNQLKENDLCPGSKVLNQINEGFR